MHIHGMHVEPMSTDPSKRPAMFAGIPDDDAGDERDRAAADTVASDRTRKRRVIALVILMLLGIILILLTPLFAWL
jgi:hypothetical protein